MVITSMKRRRGDDDDDDGYGYDDGDDDDKRVEVIVNKYGDGVSWCRDVMIGKGSFGCVYLATLKKPRSKYSYLPSLIAVKSAEVSLSGSIQKEKEVLSNVKGCSSIIQCFGEETTIGDNGDMVYNLLLEYGSGGTLADRIKGCSGGVGGGGGGALAEFEVRVYTKSILRGLNHIHGIGYVHCDMKPDNVLLVPDSGNRGCEFRAKIGDFGLAKRAKMNKKRKLEEPYWRGTPMYLSPEAVEESVQEAPCDIWALGCIVLEMLTGKTVWDGEGDEILKRIGEGHELPKIPNELSNNAKSFLKGCFVRKAMFRLTAEMLLNHPFVEGLVDEEEVKEFEDVEDVFGAESILFVAEAEDEDELSCSSFSDDWEEYGSDEDFISNWSEDVAEEFENDAQSTEAISNVTESNAGAGFGNSVKSLIQAPPPASANNTKQFPVKFTISAGV